MADCDLALAARQAVLMFLDAFEKWMIERGWLSGLTTAEIRKQWKQHEYNLAERIAVLNEG